MPGARPNKILMTKTRNDKDCEPTIGLQDTEDLVTSDETDLGNSVGVTKVDTDLRRGQALASELSNVLNHILRGGLQPGRRSAAVREGRGRCKYVISYLNT
jgi:hypothetical protein